MIPAYLFLTPNSVKLDPYTFVIGSAVWPTAHSFDAPEAFNRADWATQRYPIKHFFIRY